ncbi:MAG: 2OG-Fe(II) oxygenase [Gammaproteobacteria bacterium]|nr:2OG-Fe(II) oxygenase [Gammaproteobacteria bacterium]
MEFKKGSISVIDDIFTQDECSRLIKYYNDNFDRAIIRPDYRNLKFLEIVSHYDQKPFDDFCKKNVSKIMDWMDYRYRIQRAHIERRHPGSYMKWHLDSAFDLTVFTSVTYLNDDYDGGHTVIRPHGDETDDHNIEIVPRVGRTVFFHGAYHDHCVSEVSGGERYTIPMWYMTMPPDLPDKHKWWL